MTTFEWTLPDALVAATQLSEQELRIEFAAHLYSLGKLSLGKAAEVASIGYAAFLRELGERDIPINYDAEELEQDIATLKRLGLWS